VAAAVDVDALMGDMSVQEKCAQLGGAWIAELTTDHDLDAEKLARVLGGGIGQITRISAQTGLGPDRTADLANRVQKDVSGRI
jgi:beta-glucosidase